MVNGDLYTFDALADFEGLNTAADYVQAEHADRFYISQKEMNGRFASAKQSEGKIFSRPQRTSREEGEGSSSDEGEYMVDRPEEKYPFLFDKPW